MPGYPVSEAQLYVWILIGVVSYLILAHIICLYRHGKIAERHFPTMALNAVTAATSATLLWSVFDPTILPLLGGTTMYLIVAGVVGVGNSAYALFADRSA